MEKILQKKHLIFCFRFYIIINMITTTIFRRDIKKIIKDSIHEALEQELMRLRVIATPFVSAKEQKEIEKLYGKPSRHIGKSITIDI